MLDSGKWDRYFALFARDASVPWKRITVRLNTYSSAPVDFAAYSVDPADVLVAGTNARPRALDTSHLTAVARWKFTPPRGFTSTANDVDVPLQNHEGFYVIEARRGDAAQQVWLNISRIGFISKESAQGALVYGADLQTGRAYDGMRVSYLVGNQLQVEKTDANGISHVPAHARFALADWGESHAFVSFLPQSPPPSVLVALRADRAIVRAGESVRLVGFVRRRNGEAYVPASGDVALSVMAHGAAIAVARASLDKAGAFSATLPIPATTSAGDVAILATSAGASAGASVHVDAIADAALTLSAACSSACPASTPIDVTVALHGKAGKTFGTSSGPNAANVGSTTNAESPANAAQDVRVRVVRMPHILPPGTPDDAPQWGTTRIIDTTVQTDANGVAHVSIPVSSDGLSSTYSITASTGSANASLRLLAPTASAALSIVPLQSALDVGDPATFQIRGYDALDGTPLANASVNVKLSHGVSVQTQSVTLDPFGFAGVTFATVPLGTSIASADAIIDGKSALDVSAVTAAPRVGGTTRARMGNDVRITFDQPHVKPDAKLGVTATLGGAVGAALVTLESARGIETDVVAVTDGTAHATLNVPETLGGVAVGVTFVRDGALVDASAPVKIDGRGHERTMILSADQPMYAPGATAKIELDDGDENPGATVAVRVTDRRVAGGASFDDVATILASNGTTTQNRSSADPGWHAWVAPANSTAVDLYADDGGTSTPPPPPSMAPAESTVLAWRVARVDTHTIDLKLPFKPGHYVVAVVKVDDDGNVGSASIPVTVQ